MPDISIPVPVGEQWAVTLRYVQARRVVCGGCYAPFTYLETGTAKGAALLLSSDEEPQSDAMGQAILSLENGPRSVAPEAVHCPHCGCRFRWAWNWQCTRDVAYQSVVWAVLGALAFTLHYSWREPLPHWAAYYALLGALGGALLFGLLEFLLRVALTLCSGKQLPRSKGDEDLAEWLRRSGAEGADPFLRWLAESPTCVPESPEVVSLGMVDQLGDVVPDEYTPAASLRRLREAVQALREVSEREAKWESVDGGGPDWEADKPDILASLSSADPVDQAYAVDLLRTYAERGVDEAGELLGARGGESER